MTSKRRYICSYVASRDKTKLQHKHLLLEYNTIWPKENIDILSIVIHYDTSYVHHISQYTVNGERFTGLNFYSFQKRRKNFSVNTSTAFK